MEFRNPHHTNWQLAFDHYLTIVVPLCEKAKLLLYGLKGCLSTRYDTNFRYFLKKMFIIFLIFLPTLTFTKSLQIDYLL